MRFERRPPNEFEEFIETYWERCRRACPKLRAMGGKWEFEDLIPGLSDFDSRLVFASDTTADDWVHASLAVGEAHTALVRERPGWARMLEHTPGVNVRIDELAEVPEAPLWTFYKGEKPVTARAWGGADERFHWKKFAAYFGPYRRGIDPPVNLGRFESKYPLHSRYWHYFTPAVQAAVALVLRQPVRGKAESLRIARGLFPEPATIDMVLETVAEHYERPNDYVEPRLAGIERILERYLRGALRALGGSIPAIPADSAAVFFEHARFARLMRGRLRFYGQTIPGFETDFLIRNELGRIGQWFCDKALASYGEARFGAAEGPAAVLARVSPDLLSEGEAQAFERFAAAVRRGRKALAEIDATLEGVQRGLETLGGDLRRHAMRAGGA